MDYHKHICWFLMLGSVCFGALGDYELNVDGAKVIWNNNSQTVSISASGSATGSPDYIWPVDDATVGGQALLSDGSGVLSWGTPTTSAAHNLMSGTHSDTTNSTPPAADAFIIGNGTLWDERTPAQALASLSGEATATFSWNDQGLIDVDAITFKDPPTTGADTGIMMWDTNDGTMTWGMAGGTVQLQAGLEALRRITNKTGSTLENGKLVYATGAQGNRITVDYADNTDADKIYILGMVTEDILDNQSGYISLFGDVRGDAVEPIDTSGMLAGDKLYLSTTGDWTNTHPSGATDATIIIGRVRTVHATDGVIAFDRPSAFTLGNTFDGTMRQSIINKSAGVSAAVGFTAVNDQGHFTTIGIAGSNNAVFTNEVSVHYAPGYGDHWMAVDGAEDFVWFSDPTDSHNNSSLNNEIMRLDYLGNLTNTGYASNLNFTDSSHYTGFPNRDDTSLSWDDGTFTLTLTATNDKIWIDGVEYNINTLTQTVTEVTSGLYWFWITAPGGTPQLNSNTTAPGFDTCLTATVYWNTTTNLGLYSDERHWFGRDQWWHESHHETIGALYVEGMALTLPTAVTSDDFQLESGEFYDEDIEHIHAQQTLCTVLYHDGDSDWAWIQDQAFAYKTDDGLSTGTLQYNNGTALANATANRYVNYWMFTSGDEVNPTHIVIGTSEHVTLAGAEAEDIPSLGALPSAEELLIYKITYRNTGGTATFVEAVDFRGSSGTGSGGFTPSSHTALSDLVWTSSNHTGTASTFAGFDAVGVAAEYTESDYTLADGTRAFSGNQSFGDNDITNVGDIALDTISADDGSSFSMSDDWTNAGNTVADLGTVTTADINGGSVDGAVIGGASAAAVTGTSFTIGAASINEAELETIDGVVAGTASADKALVVDSNKDLISINTLGTSGTITSGGLGIFNLGAQIGGSGVNGSKIDRATSGTTTVTHYIGNETIDTTASDERLKDNIEDVNIDPMEFIRNFPMKQYNRRYDFPEAKEIGMTAQMLDKVYPQFVRKPYNPQDMESHWSIKYSKITPILIEAIKKQQAEINQLKQRVIALEN